MFEICQFQRVGKGFYITTHEFWNKQGQMEFDLQDENDKIELLNQDILENETN